jgi:hypothetical protein
MTTTTTTTAKDIRVVCDDESATPRNLITGTQLSTRKFESRMSKKERRLSKVSNAHSVCFGNTQCHTVTLKLDYLNSVVREYSDFRRSECPHYR